MNVCGYISWPQSLTAHTKQYNDLLTVHSAQKEEYNDYVFVFCV